MKKIVKNYFLSIAINFPFVFHHEIFHFNRSKFVITPNLKCLLDLNLKFIPRQRFTTFHMEVTFKRFCQQVYIQDFYLNNPVDTREEPTDSSYNHKLHIPTHWIPAVWKVNPSTVAKTDNFLYYIDKLFQRRQCTPNLSLSQLHLLKFLRKKDNFIIAKADKNLDPCIIESEQYIKYALDDHLSCKTTYHQLSHSSANLFMDSVKKKINSFLRKHRKSLSTEALKVVSPTKIFANLFFLIRYVVQNCT